MSASSKTESFLHAEMASYDQPITRVIAKAVDIGNTCII